MREVDQKNQSKDDEYAGTDERDIVAPEHEEAVRDEECHGSECDPKENLGTPEARQCLQRDKRCGRSGKTNPF